MKRKIIVLVLLVLVGCSKEYSRECSGCKTVTTIYYDGRPVSEYETPVACDTAVVGTRTEVINNLPGQEIRQEKVTTCN